MPSLEQLGNEKYVLLTTYRKDGRAVPTPLWVVPHEGGVAFWTVQGTGKVKRIRRDGRVTLTACDMRGNPQGESVEAQARLGGADEHAHVIKTLGRKYGLLGRLTLFGSRLRRGADGTVAIIVS